MEIPKIGFGTWQLQDGAQAYDSTLAALKAGYRLIDTAKIYGNEASVGRAIKDSGLDRNQIFVTTKLWMSDMGYDSSRSAFADSLARLGLDYIDLYLIHWPGRSAQVRQESWRALETIKKEGAAKRIGVSNYRPEHLEEMSSYATEQPYANQIEFHPFIYTKQKPTLNYCLKNNIIVEAYSPLAQASSLNNEVLVKIAGEHNATAAQVMLAWALAQKTVPIPRSSNPDRIAQNLDAGDLNFSDDDIEKINSLSIDKSVLG